MTSGPSSGIRIAVHAMSMQPTSWSVSSFGQGGVMTGLADAATTALLALRASGPTRHRPTGDRASAAGGRRRPGRTPVALPNRTQPPPRSWRGAVSRSGLGAVAAHPLAASSTHRDRLAEQQREGLRLLLRRHEPVASTAVGEGAAAVPAARGGRRDRGVAIRARRLGHARESITRRVCRATVRSARFAAGPRRAGGPDRQRLDRCWCERGAHKDVSNAVIRGHTAPRPMPDRRDVSPGGARSG